MTTALTEVITYGSEGKKKKNCNERQGSLGNMLL